jgi:formylglycine-generating enzyme required for sulfatase activity
MSRHLIIFLGLLINITACSDNQSSFDNNNGDSSDSAPAIITGPSFDNTKRIALIIGNADYKKVPSLDNPVNDADDMKTILTQLGFEVILGRNLSRRAMLDKAYQFGQRLQNGGVGLFYFSGHGVQTKHRNYLLPVDAFIRTEAEIEYESMDAGRVLAQMEQANKAGVNIIILDACRDNPFKDTPMKSLTKGLAKMDSPRGTLIAYATAPNLASYGDSAHRNSIYTKYLLSALQQKSHLSVLDMLTGVTNQVVAETQGLQVPWQAASLTHRFCFGDCVQSPPPRPNISALLRTCETHFEAGRLTSGRGGNALACYENVLKKDPTNALALAGLAKIEARYADWAEQALRQKKLDKAKEHLARLRQLNPNSPELAALEQQIDNNTFVAGKVIRDRLKDGTLGPEMVWIPGGRFKMGDIQGGGSSDEKPVHWVSVNQFAMGKYELTVGEFRRFVKATDYKTDAEKGEGCYVDKEGKGSWGYVKEANWRNPYFSQNNNHPVTCISWNDASAYAQWLSRQTGQHYRLPTEAEWEYAARAGTTTARYWGNNPDEACRYANVADKTFKQKYSGWIIHICTDGYVYTAPVGRFKPNAFGLFDMIGNLWEWTCSEYEGKYTGKEKRCVKSAGRFAARGASWLLKARGARSAFRGSDSPTSRYDNGGGRLARMQ